MKVCTASSQNYALRYTYSMYIRFPIVMFTIQKYRFFTFCIKNKQFYRALISEKYVVSHRIIILTFINCNRKRKQKSASIGMEVLSFSSRQQNVKRMTLVSFDSFQEPFFRHLDLTSK